MSDHPTRQITMKEMLMLTIVAMTTNSVWLAVTVVAAGRDGDGGKDEGNDKDEGDDGEDDGDMDVIMVTRT